MAKQFVVVNQESRERHAGVYDTPAQAIRGAFVEWRHIDWAITPEIAVVVHKMSDTLMMGAPAQRHRGVIYLPSGVTNFDVVVQTRA